MTKQYRYSPDIDSTILTTKTVKFIMELIIELTKHISPTRQKGLKREMEIFSKLKRDWKRARSTMGTRGNKECKHY